MDKIERMNELIDKLNIAARAYYSTDKEIMSNYKYDTLYDELVSLEKETGIVNSNSPTIKVGYEVVSELPKETHTAPMLSLDKTKEVSELSAFAGNHKCLLSWKMDGLTVVLTYREGNFFKAVTRGNGEVGEVITNNARTFKNIPLSIPYKGELIIRGEAVIGYDDFKRINESITNAEEKYKNPRNLCSGSVRQLNNEITATRNVNFFVFSLVEANEEGFDNSREKQLLWLKNQGFTTVDYKVVDETNMKEAVEEFSEEIKKYPFPSDGLVLLYDDIAYGRSLGRTAKFPRDSIAFKWADETIETKLIDVEWSPSRTGLINPVAIFEPVELEGTTVSRASVHNISIVEELKLGIGDIISVYKANMIIPQIAENKTKSGNLAIPSKCPACGGETSIKCENDTKTLMCYNELCIAKHIKGLAHFVSRDGMNIDGLSENTLEKIVGHGLIKDQADIYELSHHRDILVNMEGFGEKSFDNLCKAIDNTRVVPLFKLINSLGITGVGLAGAKLISKHFDDDIQRIRNASIEEVSAIEGVGPVIAASVCEYFKNPNNINLLDRLLKEITIEKKEAKEKVSNASIDGKVFVITGTVNHFSNRNELKEIIEDMNGKVTGSVTKKTDYLINNDVNSSSSKNKTAKELGVPIISEEEFIKMAGITDR